MRSDSGSDKAAYGAGFAGGGTGTSEQCPFSASTTVHAMQLVQRQFWFMAPSAAAQGHHFCRASAMAMVISTVLKRGIDHRAPVCSAVLALALVAPFLIFKGACGSNH